MKDINAEEQQTGTGPSTTATIVTNTSNRKPILPKLNLSEVLRNRPVSPLLDLHADYDENSLPSPTRDNAVPLPVPKPVGFVPTSIALAHPVIRNNPNSVSVAEGDGTKLQPYIKDAFKAVSTYQQRYGKSTVFVTDDLPSPTPSDEEIHKKDVDFGIGEASSSPISVTSESIIASLLVPQLAPVKQTGVKSAPKNRDPRLRLISPETRGSSSEPNPNPDTRKKKAAEGSLIDECRVKRQRNGLGKGGWLEETNDRPLQPSTTNFNQQSTSAGPTVSTPTTRKDVAVNPTMLVKLLQQKLASELQPKTSTSNPPPRLTPGPAPDPAPVIPENGPATKPAEPVPSSNISAARVIQPPAQPAALVRMKPRDPRRILHNSTATNTSSSAPDLLRPNGPPSIDRATIREQAEPAGTSNTSGLKGAPDMAPGGSGSWGNVEYLLDGYNDEQKAAIQRERARRIAEQNKMFAAKKLCLVLDLDHTLLNSAKVYIYIFWWLCFYLIFSSNNLCGIHHHGGFSDVKKL